MNSRTNRSKTEVCTTERANIRVLLTGTNRWALAARLAMSLNDIGCEVFAVCPAGSSAIARTQAVRRYFRYSGVRPLASLDRAIRAVNPDLVIPTCDRGVEHLHELYAQAKKRGPEAQAVTELIESSLGAAEYYSLISSRYDLLALAQEEGVRVPRFGRLTTDEELDRWREREPLPWVMKADGTWGGQGVRVVHSLEAAKSSMAELPRRFRLHRAIKRLIVNRDSFWLRPWWRGIKRPVTVQSFIHGRPANCTAVCWKGQLLALICVEVVRSHGATGPASVIRIVENRDMRAAAERIAGRLRLSGFFGLDFMIEEGTNDVLLIEMNPRPTPPCYLRLGEGHDLPGALMAKMTGQSVPKRPPATTNRLIAYFPLGIKGNEDILPHCYRDTPQGDSQLLEELVHPFPDRTLLFRLVQWLSRKRAQGAPDGSGVWDRAVGIEADSDATLCGEETVQRPKKAANR